MGSNSTQTAPVREGHVEQKPAPKPAEKPFTIKVQSHIPF